MNEYRWTTSRRPFPTWYRCSRICRRSELPRRGRTARLDAPPAVRFECLRDSWIERRGSECIERRAPDPRCAFRRRLCTILAPRAVVAPVRNQRRVEGILVTRHRMSSCKEVTARTRLSNGLDRKVLVG